LVAYFNGLEIIYVVGKLAPPTSDVNTVVAIPH